MTISGERVVFPIGHNGGRRPGERHQVRLGRSAETLTSDEFAIWVLAHGSPTVGKAAWTVRDTVRTAEGERVTGASDIVSALDERGLLHTIAAGSGATDFARAYRMTALLTGLGDTPGNPGTYAVGVPGTPAATWLDFDAYELWQWGSLAPTLSHVCEARASVLTKLGEPCEPAAALGCMLGDLRLLIAHGCAYLDTAAPYIGE